MRFGAFTGTGSVACLRRLVPNLVHDPGEGPFLGLLPLFLADAPLKVG